LTARLLVLCKDLLHNTQTPEKGNSVAENNYVGRERSPIARHRDLIKGEKTLQSGTIQYMRVKKWKERHPLRNIHKPTQNVILYNQESILHHQD